MLPSEPEGELGISIRTSENGEWGSDLILPPYEESFDEISGKSGFSD